jgi:hypothetical protein
MIINKPSTKSGDFVLEVALGNVANYHAVNKFGHAPDCDSGVATDVWDGADGITSTDIWAAPTAARVHALVSSSAEDDDAADGDGMRTIMVHGLTSWADTEETTEIIALDGATPVNTVNSYVIIYRMMGMSFGPSATNEGIIKATAATDSTVTAVIQIGNGQTLMAIFGIPSGTRFAVYHMACDMIANASADALGRLIVETMVDSATSGERTQREWNFRRDSRYDATIRPPLTIAGPAILKLQVVTDAASVACTGTFDGILARTDAPAHSDS